MKKFIYLFAVLALCVAVQSFTTHAVKVHTTKAKRINEYPVGYFTQNGITYNLWVSQGTNRTAWVTPIDSSNVSIPAPGRFDAAAQTATFTYNPTGSHVLVYSGPYYY